MFNVLGQPIDEKPAPKGVKYMPIHRKAPSFEEQSTSTEILEICLNINSIINLRKLTLLEFNIKYRTDNLSDFSDI